MPRTRTNSLAAALVAIILEGVLALKFPLLANACVRLDLRVLQALGQSVGSEPDRFLRQPLVALTFAMPHHGYGELAVWIGTCVVAIFVLSALRLLDAPFRYLITFNLLIVASEAMYLLFFGELGYSPHVFSALLLHTMIVTWLVLPIFVTIVAALFPFRLHELVALVLGCLVYDIVLANVRYIAFIAVLQHTGPILMSDLYLFFGPLLDSVPLVALFAMALRPLARRMHDHPEDWVCL